MNIGWFGGGLICELGPPAEVQSFFSSIQRYAIAQAPNEDWDIITDRLYMRYVPHEHTEMALEIMRQVERIFHQTPFDPTDKALSGLDRKNSQIEWDAETLGEAYAHYFDFYVECSESISHLLACNMHAEPLRIIVTDMPQRGIEEQRPLNVYDAIDPPPLWILPLPERDLGD